MKIKRLLLCLMVFLGVSLGAKADTYFQYPIVPDSIKLFQSRCDYMARHFGDFCELKKAFSAKHKMAREFNVYISILRNATPDSAIASVNRFTKKLEKQPADQLFMAECAENLLYGDTAEMWIDELYLPFAEAVASNKRIDKASKARFAHQAKILKNSMTGKRFASLPYTTREGQSRNLDSDSAQFPVVFFNDPDCDDCNMARIRLDADISMTELISEGKAKIVAISLTEPSDEWKQSVGSYPSAWSVGANPDADLTVDLRNGTPDFYIIDKNHNVRFKHLTIDRCLTWPDS